MYLTYKRSTCIIKNKYYEINVLFLVLLTKSGFGSSTFVKVQFFFIYLLFTNCFWARFWRGLFFFSLTFSFRLIFFFVDKRHFIIVASFLFGWLFARCGQSSRRRLTLPLLSGNFLRLGRFSRFRFFCLFLRCFFRWFDLICFL